MAATYKASAAHFPGKFTEEQNKANERVSEAMKQFDEAKFLAEIVCTKNVSDALASYGLLGRHVVKLISQGQESAWSDNLDSLTERTKGVMSAVQLELTTTSDRALDNVASENH
jgi:hypothetical protein